MFGDIEEPDLHELQQYHYAFIAEIQKLYAIKHDPIQAYEHLINLYRYLKEITPHIYSRGENYKVYNAITNLLLNAEDKIFDKSIIDVVPDFSYEKNHRLDYNLDHYSSHEQLLDELVYSTRKKLVTTGKYLYDLKNMNLSNKCKYASSIFYRKTRLLELASNFLCGNAEAMGLKVRKIIIHPGYSQKSYLYNGDGFHYFNIVTIEGKDYIVDCSYAQFFTQGKNCLERLGLMDFSGCYPGVYMLQNETRTKVATELLRKGWCEATDENMKAYLDGFTLMYRNGLYYENIGDANYEVDYTIDQYMNFLYGDDDQVKHEGREFLGYQRRMLKDPSFKFIK